MTESRGPELDLESEDADVRWAAADALARRAGEEAEDQLIGLLADEDYRVRERAVAALARRFSPRIASACAVALADEANAGHRAAGLALLARGGPAGRAVLLGALQHPSPDVRLAAAGALPGRGPDAAAVAAIEAAARREGDPNARAALLLALGRTGRREAAAPLLAALDEPSLWLQVHALEGLALLGDPDVVPRLLPLLPSPSLRSPVLATLARLHAAVPAEPLLRQAAAGDRDPLVLAALRTALEAAPPGVAGRLAGQWPDAASVLLGIVADPEAPLNARTDSAHLLALFDVPGACLALATHGPFLDGFAALERFSESRLPEVLSAVLQSAEPEPALEVVDAFREGPRAAQLLPLLVHPSPSVKAAVLSALPPGLAPIEDLIDVLAEDDPETSLPAALALASSPPRTPPDRIVIRRKALLDRAAGADGPGRTAALLALAGVGGADVAVAIRGALASPDPEVRRAAVAAGSEGTALGDLELVAAFADPHPGVRAAALRGLASRAEIGSAPAGFRWRDALVFLVDEPSVAAAAGAALIALAGEERPRLVDDMLAQEGPVRVAALEEIVRTGDAEAAAQAAVAVEHEDPETARAAVSALRVAPSDVAEQALAVALEDPRDEVRAEAGLVVAERPAPLPGGLLPPALAAALSVETSPVVLPALLSAVAVASGDEAIAPLTEVLARERLPREAAAAAEALALRFPEACRRAWAIAPPRAERRWSHAIAATSGRRRGRDGGRP